MTHRTEQRPLVAAWFLLWGWGVPSSFPAHDEELSLQRWVLLQTYRWSNASARVAGVHARACESDLHKTLAYLCPGARRTRARPRALLCLQSADPAPHALRDLLLLPSSSRRVQRSSCGSASELERLGRSTKKSKNSHAQRQNPGLMLGIRELKDLGPLGDELRAARGPDCRGGGGREEGRGEGPNPQREENVCVTHPPPQTKFSFSLRGSLWKMKMMKISAVLHQKKRLLRGWGGAPALWLEFSLDSDQKFKSLTLRKDVVLSVNILD